MPGHGSFWRNVAVIGVGHLVMLAGLLRWSATATKPLAADIVWLEGGAVPMEAASASEKEREPEGATLLAEAEPSVTPMEDPLTMRTPPPAPDAEEPEPAPTPRPTPKVTPKPTVEPTPKKAATKSSPKPSATPKKPSEAKKVSVKPVTTTGAVAPEKKSSSPASSANAGGSGGQASGPGGASQFAWYGSMLHDRFFSEWVQPKSVAMSGAKMSALVRVRIEGDGRVSAFNIVRSSGNVVVDESVDAVARRVTQVDPLPAGLAQAGHYDVNINFELNPE